jgi:hypothetical protein
MTRLEPSTLRRCRTEADVHGVGVAEQVVQVAENLLVGADQEHAEVVRLAGEGVQQASVFFTSRRSMN